MFWYYRTPTPANAYFLAQAPCARWGYQSDAINHTTKYTTKMKAKFSYCDQIKLETLLRSRIIKIDIIKIEA